MTSKKMMQAYQKADRHAAAEAGDPHALVSMLFEELLRHMRLFVATLEDDNADLEARSKHFSRSLTILYGLQNSLNFEQGGEIVENLFRLYEYARQQLLSASRTNDETGTNAAINALQDIYDAWSQIESCQSNIAERGTVMTKDEFLDQFTQLNLIHLLNPRLPCRILTGSGLSMAPAVRCYRNLPSPAYRMVIRRSLIL